MAERSENGTEYFFRLFFLDDWGLAKNGLISFFYFLEKANRWTEHESNKAKSVAESATLLA